MREEAVRPGDILAGKYRVERVLGQGGMGIVVAARHIRLDELVAIKFLLPGIEPDEAILERFAREARAASKIKSEHVARVTDVDSREDGTTYMVMEFLEGQDLGALLDAEGPLPIVDAVGYVLQMCEAIAEAHSLGIVHRDIKPENLFLARRRDGSTVLKVLDFGISKVVVPGGEGGVTHAKGIVGSPHYMSPEQLLAARTVDARTDVWAAGVTLYQLLTGKLPFWGDTLPETCSLVMQSTPEAPRDLRPDIPAALEDAILRCLEKDREARFQNMAELAFALVEHGPPQGRLWVERAASMAGVTPPRPSSGSRSGVHDAPRSSRASGRHGAADMANMPTLEATAITQDGQPAGRRLLVAGAIAAAAIAIAVFLVRSAATPSGPTAAPAGAAIEPAMPSATSPPMASSPEPAVVPVGSGVPAPALPDPSASAAASASASAWPGRRPPGAWPRPPAPKPTEDTIGF